MIVVVVCRCFFFSSSFSGVRNSSTSSSSFPSPPWWYGPSLDPLPGGGTSPTPSPTLRSLRHSSSGSGRMRACGSARSPVLGGEEALLEVDDILRGKGREEEEDVVVVRRRRLARAVVELFFVVEVEREIFFFSVSAPCFFVKCPFDLEKTRSRSHSTLTLSHRFIDTRDERSLLSLLARREREESERGRRRERESGVGNEGPFLFSWTRSERAMNRKKNDFFSLSPPSFLTKAFFRSHINNRF